MEKKIKKVSKFHATLAQDDIETVGALLSDELGWDSSFQFRYGNTSY